MRELTGFQRDLLYAISKFNRPPGVQIREFLIEELGTDVSHARVYLNLDTLVDKGLVEKGKYDERTNAYKLTENGSKEVSNYVLSWSNAV